MPASTFSAMYPAGAAPKADGLDLDTFLKAARSCNKAGVPSASASARPRDSVDTAGAIFNCVRRRARRRRRATSRQDRRGPAGARILQAAREDSAAGRAGLGRCVQQQVAGLGPRRDDHEPAVRLGRRHARRAADRRADLAPRHAAGPEGPLRAVPALLLGHLELLARTSPRRSACCAHLSTRELGREDGRGEQGLRHSRLRELHDFKTWAEIGPPKGTMYHYPNPHNHQILSIAAAPAPQRSPSRSTRRV